MKRMAALGIQGTAKYQESQYQGILQKDLAAAIKANSDCKLAVLRELKDKLIPSPSSKRARVLYEKVVWTGPPSESQCDLLVYIKNFGDDTGTLEGGGARTGLARVVESSPT